MKEIRIAPGRVARKKKSMPDFARCSMEDLTLEYAPTCPKIKRGGNEGSHAEPADIPHAVEEDTSWNPRRSTSLSAQLGDSAAGPLETSACSTGSSRVG